MGRPLREVLMDPGVLEGLKGDPEGYTFREAPSILITMVSWPTHTLLRLEDMNSRKVLDGIPTNFPIAGPMSHMLAILSSSLNFTYKQLVPPDVSWGVRSPNGSWSGMVRQVFTKHADMGLGPFQVIQSRTQDVDMTIPFFYDTLSLMIARGSAKIDPWGFLMPFNPSVWGAFFLIMFIISLVHFILDRFDHPESNCFSQFGKIVFDYCQPPMGHALHQIVWRSWHRPLIGSWVLLSLLLNSSYDGTLRSLMALRHIPHPIQTLRDAIDATSRKLIVEHRTSFTDILGRVPYGEIRELDQVGKSGRYIDLKMRDFMTYYPLVKEGHIQIFDVSTSLKYFGQYFSETARCDFYIAREKFIPTMYAMVLQKNSPITPAINARVRRLVEAGFYDYWVYSNSANITACANPPMKVAIQDPIGLGSIWGVGVIWGVGMLLAFTTLLSEMVIAWIRIGSGTNGNGKMD